MTTSGEQQESFQLGEGAARRLAGHRADLVTCRACARMVGPVVAPPPVVSPVLLLGQAPGPHEADVGRPFGWSAGRTLFDWLATVGVGEEDFRDNVYMAAVCRCFPGKSRGGGDRVPSAGEIETCSAWLAAEVEILQPNLLIPVGRLAIAQVLDFRRLDEVVGGCHRAVLHGRELDVVPLPHPSGASTWHRNAEGRSLLLRALEILADHPVFRRTVPRRTLG